MASGHDLDLAGRIEAGTAAGVSAVDDAALVVECTPGAAHVDPADLPAAIALAAVRVAEVVLARAREAERDLTRDLASSPKGGGAPTPSELRHFAEADRQAVRFSVAILVPAQLGGLAVYAADGMVLAPALPAAALLGVLAVVLSGRRRSRPEPASGIDGPDRPASDVGVEDSPAIRAAQAHLRRREAAWKVAWWVREKPVPDAVDWSPGWDRTLPITLVTVDLAREIDATAHAAMTATAPAAVHVVVLQARG